jgi:MGT family glycosyltransferase
MGNFLLFNVPYRGHINPTLPIIQELVKHGHNVTYCSFSAHHFKQAIESTGAAFLSCDVPRDGHDLSSISSYEAELRIASCVLEQALRIAGARRPDILMYDSMCFWGMLFARMLCIPAVRLHTTFAINEYFHPFSPYSPKMPWRADVLAQQERILAYFVARYELPAFDYPEVLFQAEALNIVFLPPEFHPAVRTFDESFVFVGPSIYPRDDVSDFPLHQLGTSPVLFVSLGSIWNRLPLFFDACINAFGGQPRLVVLSVGDSIDRKVFGPLPGNVVIHSYVPQLEVLQRADTFVTHGGPNSIMEALYYGVPVVVIPLIFDERIVAERVAALRLGITFEGLAHVTTHTLREAVSSVKGDLQVRANIREMQNAIVNAGGYPRAVNAILEMARKVCA